MGVSNMCKSPNSITYHTCLLSAPISYKLIFSITTFRNEEIDNAPERLTMPIYLSFIINNENTLSWMGQVYSVHIFWTNPQIVWTLDSNKKRKQATIAVTAEIEQCSNCYSNLEFYYAVLPMPRYVTNRLSTDFSYDHSCR